MYSSKPSERPKFKVIWLLPLLMFLALAALLGSRLGHDPRIIPQTTNAKPLPAFQLTDLLTQRVLTNSDLPHTPYLLNVWGSWCPTCVEEQPKLLQLAADGVVLVGMNYKDTPEDANHYIQQHGNPYQLIMQDQAGRYGLDLGVTGAPETYVIDATGVIRQHLIGAVTDEVWLQKIKPCLAQLTLAMKTLTATGDVQCALL